jgi:putative membrane protein
MYLYIKAIHVIFVVSWFAGLFYLPRIFVNLAMTPKESHAEYGRLLLMARKLFRFTTIIAIPALASGWIMLHIYEVGMDSAWMHIKLDAVILTIVYHASTYYWLQAFEKNTVRRGHVWFRWYNEIPIVLLVVAVFMVILKPF